MKKLFVLLLLLAQVATLAQQNKGYFNGGFESNMQWYAKDQNQFDAGFEDYFRSNNFLKLDYQYQNFYAGIQLESYAPQALLNYDPKLNKSLGLATYFLKYQSKYVR